MIENLFQASPNTLSLRAAVNQKCPRPLAAPDFGDELFNLLPRRDPFAPDEPAKAGNDGAADQNQDEPEHRAFNLLQTFYGANLGMKAVRGRSALLKRFAQNLIAFVSRQLWSATRLRVALEAAE